MTGCSSSIYFARYHVLRVKRMSTMTRRYSWVAKAKRNSRVRGESWGLNGW